MQHIDYLNLKDINSPLQQDILDAIHQVVESGWYLQGKATSSLLRLTPSTSARSTAYRAETDWML